MRRLLFRVLVVLTLLFVFARVVNTDFLRDTIHQDRLFIHNLWTEVGEIWTESKEERRG